MAGAASSRGASVISDASRSGRSSVPVRTLGDGIARVQRSAFAASDGSLLKIHGDLRILRMLRNFGSPVMNTSVAASDVQKNFGFWHDKALREPVQVTKYGRETVY